MNFEIVEVKGRKYAQFQDSKENRVFLRKVVLIAGGNIYKNGDGIVYQGIGEYGNLQEWYKKLIEKFA